MAYCIRRVRVKRTLVSLVLFVLALYLCFTIPLYEDSKNATPFQALSDNSRRKNIEREASLRAVSFHRWAHSNPNGSTAGIIAKENYFQFIASEFNNFQPNLVLIPENPQKETPRNNPQPTFHSSKRLYKKFNYSHQHLTAVQQLNNVSIAYEKKWIGFPDIDGRYCQQAIYSNVSNNLFKTTTRRITGYRYTGNSTQCRKFRDYYGYNRYPKASEEETNFPIAFIILFHNNFDQVMFLLRAIYHPHNVYCLSMDAKNNKAYISSVKEILQCLPNVFLATKLEKIVYASFSRLLADIHCMEDLLKHPVQWRYVINMPGQQFPLRTNLELVRILTKLNGTNDIEGVPSNASIPRRYLFKHIQEKDRNTGKLKMAPTPERNPPPPHNLTIIKGSTYCSFSREFVHFALNHPIAKNFLEYCKNMLSPDEYFWATLQHTSVVHVPGGYTGDPSLKRFITSYSLWAENTAVKCATKRVHKICIFTPEDLSNLVQQDSLFANKFFIYYHPAALHCMDEWLFHRTVSGTVINMTVYDDLSKYSHKNQ